MSGKPIISFELKSRSFSKCSQLCLWEVKTFFPAHLPLTLAKFFQTPTGTSFIVQICFNAYRKSPSGWPPLKIEITYINSHKTAHLPLAPELICMSYLYLIGSHVALTAGDYIIRRSYDIGFFSSYRYYMIFTKHFARCLYNYFCHWESKYNFARFCHLWQLPFWLRHQVDMTFYYFPSRDTGIRCAHLFNQVTSYKNIFGNWRLAPLCHSATSRHRTKGWPRVLRADASIWIIKYMRHAGWEYVFGTHEKRKSTSLCLKTKPPIQQFGRCLSTSKKPRFVNLVVTNHL